MTFRDNMLKLLDRTRGIPSRFDLRRYDVLLRVRRWSGIRPGLGTKSNIDLPILVNQGQDRPKVKLLSTKEIIASNGLYIDGDYRIGRVTPLYFLDSLPQGFTPDDLRPILSTSPQLSAEVFFRLTGPGMETGAWFSTVEVSVERNLHYTFIIRKTAEIVT